MTTATAPTAAADTDTPKRVVETADYSRMMTRMVKAFHRRVAAGDVASLPLLAELRDEVDAAIDTAVRQLYLDHDYSWTDIGRELGITRQAARQRYAHLVPERPADRRSGQARRAV